jgi:hypothetical protein
MAAPGQNPEFLNFLEKIVTPHVEKMCDFGEMYHTQAEWLVGVVETQIGKFPVPTHGSVLEIITNRFSQNGKFIEGLRIKPEVLVHYLYPDRRVSCTMNGELIGVEGVKEQEFRRIMDQQTADQQTTRMSHMHWVLDNIMTGARGLVWWFVQHAPKIGRM